MIELVKYLGRKLQIRQRYLRNLSGFHKEEVAGMADVLPIES
jgi:hypothetical protein